MDYLILFVKENFLFSTVLALAVVLVIQILWSRRYFYYNSWKLDGPFACPLIGNFREFPVDPIEMLERGKIMDAKYKSVYSVWIFKYFIVRILNPEDIQVITTSPLAIDKPLLYNFGGEWTGNGLFASKTDIWRRRRKIMSMAFTQSMMDHYIEVFNEQSHIFVSEIADHANSNAYFDIFEYATRFTLDVACETVMGQKLHSQLKNPETQKYDNEYGHATDRAFQILYQRFRQPLFISNFFFSFSKLYQEYQKCCLVFNKITEAVIAKAKDERVIRLMNNNNNNNSNEKKAKTFLDMLINNNEVNKLNDRDLRDELNTMIAGGADTSGHVLGFVFLMLAMFPEVQEKVYDEIQETVGDTYLTREQLLQLTYMDQVFKETIRLFPLFCLIGRELTGDVKLKTKDITLTADTKIVISVMGLHLNKTVWGDDAEQFKPDRFSPENCSKRHLYSFMGFSAGQRNCIGHKFGKFSMKVLVVNVLRKYKMRTEEKFEDIQCQYNVMLKKVGGWKIKIDER